MVPPVVVRMALIAVVDVVDVVMVGEIEAWFSRTKPAYGVQRYCSGEKDGQNI